MTATELSHIVYASSVSPAFSEGDLKAILEGSRVNNATLSVTGMLLYTEGSFFQVLEGPASPIAELLEIIRVDPRHTKVTKIIEEPISRRDFGDWTMGFSHVDRSDLGNIEGLSDFFHEGNSFADLPPGRAKRLLSAFAEGRWRLRGD